MTDAVDIPRRVDRPPVERDDVRLIAGIQHSEQAALAGVYRRHGPRLHDLASRVCGPERAGGVVEQVLLELWQDPTRFDPGQSSLQSFLVWQTHAGAVRAVRSGGPRPIHPRSLHRRKTAAGRDLGAWLPGRVGGPAWRRLSALPDDERDAIALVYFCGHGPDELVGELDQSADIWAKRIRSGLGRLARQSSGEEPWPS